MYPKVNQKGVTSNSYDDNVIILDLSASKEPSLFIKNLSDSNSLKFKILEKETGITIVNETTVLKNEDFRKYFNYEKYHKLEVYIKSNTDYLPADYQLLAYL